MKNRKIWAIVLFIFMNIGALSAQGITVSGVVLDELNEGLPMANIKISGTGTGTVTDINGNFTLKVPDKKSTLEISYVGYQKKVVSVDSGTRLTVRLQPDSKALDEVVIVGFGVQKKANATGAVKTIDNAAIESRPITSATQGLQGVIAGLNITNDAGGSPGQAMNINIRGSGSIGEGSNASPLVIIDGIEGDLATVNPNDIENISVLKDAAAASIYGSRAPFGVIIVTTKSGEKGLSVSYSGNLRVNTPSNTPTPADSWTYANIINDAFSNTGRSPLFGAAIMQKMLDYQRGLLPSWTEADAAGKAWKGGDNAWGNTNWYDEHLRSATYSHEHNLSVSGGGDKITYFFSGNYLNQNGLFKYADDFYNRLSLSGKVNIKLLDNLTFNWSSRFVNDEKNKPTALNDLLFHNLGRRSPTVGILLPNGEYSSNSLIPTLQNGGRTVENGQTFYNQAQLTYDPIKGAGWKVYADFGSRIENPRNTRQMKKLSFTNPDGRSEYFQVLEGLQDKSEVNPNGIIVRQPLAGINFYEVGQGFGNYISTNFRTDYEKTLGDHYFKVLAGVQTEYYYKEYLRTSSDNIASDEVPFIPTIPVNALTSNTKGEWANVGIFGRINYSYANRYLLEVNFRADAASRFPTNQRWGTFPAFSLGWNIAEESFFESAKDWGFDLLKIRGSYGLLGNQNTTSFYPYFQKIITGPASYVIDGKSTNKINIPDPHSNSLTWEKIENAGAGLDFALLSGRISGSFDWYQRTTKDMVGPANALPAVYGATPPKTNNAELRTRGWELEVGYQDRIGKDWSYNVNVTLSDYQTVLTKYDSPDGSLASYYQGMNLGNIWGYQVAGIAQSDLEMKNHLAKYDQSSIKQPFKGVGGDISTIWGAGDLMYRDINGDGKVNSGSGTIHDYGDLSIIGNNTPRYSYGIRAGFKYKFIDFSLFLQGVGKREFFFENSATFWGVVAQYQRSIFMDHADYWRPAGDALGYNPDAYYPRIRTDNNNQQISDRYLQDASYLRLKNIQLGFSLPKGTWSKVIKNARIYFSGENLFTFTKLRLYDPEAIGGGDWGNGKTYPMYGTYSVGLSITL